MDGSNRLAAGDREHLIHGYTNLSRHRASGAKMIVRGEGARVFDEQGRDYIEAAAGMWCANFGFSEPALAEAAMAQFARLPYYHTLASKSVDMAAALADRLAGIVPIPNAHIYFAVTGSEANDFLVKFLWYYNNAIGRPLKKRVISRVNGFHGATIAATSMTGIARNHLMFDAPLERFSHVGDINHYQCALPGESEQDFAIRLAEELEAEILRLGPETVMAFLAEPITGGGGVGIAPADYYARVQAILKKYDIFFIADEVINGFGRTGEMFGCQTCGIEPDAMVLAKGLTGAYQPLAAIVVSERIYQGLEQGSDSIGSFVHGATYSGYPVGCAVALKALDLIKERGILDNVRARGAELSARLKALEDHPNVGEVRGRGLLGAIEFVADKATRRGFDPPGSFAQKVQAAAESQGVITRAAPTGDIIALSPPLTITQAELAQAMDRLEAGLKLAASA